eukprot:3649804-Pleurochrysis_carterae.AAC.1
MSVCELPPSESCSRRVSLLSRYGTWDEAPSSAAMTLPSASSPWLMVTDSLNRWPSAPVFLARSDPAKSTRLNLERTTSPVARSVREIKIVTSECERELSSFISVAP